MKYQSTLRLAICVVVFYAAMISTAIAQTYVAQIPLGTNTNSIAVNPITNRVYVGNSNQGTVSVINGSTRSVVTAVNTGETLVESITVDWQANRIYVGARDFQSGDAFVVVIDGNTNTVVDRIFVSNGPFFGISAIAVNPKTHRVYAADTDHGAIAVIDGVRDQIITSVPTAFEPFGVAVNFITNLVYTNTNSPVGQVFVIDGRTNQIVHTLSIGGFPIQLVANTTDNKIYAEATGASFPTPTSPGIYVIDGATNTVSAVIPALDSGVQSDMNPIADRLWSAENDTVSLINGKSNAVLSSLSLGVPIQTLAVNPNTNTAYVLIPGAVDVISGAQGAYGNCPAPLAPGVDVCLPAVFAGAASIAAPFQVIASGTGAKGPVRLMELWADGSKIGQTAGSLFDAPVTLQSGTHELTAVELDTTGAYVKSSPFTVDVQGLNNEECAAPGTPGVNVCVPTTGSCHTSGWTTIVAAGTGASGGVSRMELWIDGVKIANFAGNRINTNLFVSDFSVVTVIEVDSNGNFIKSLPITIESC